MIVKTVMALTCWTIKLQGDTWFYLTHLFKIPLQFRTWEHEKISKKMSFLSCDLKTFKLVALQSPTLEADSKVLVRPCQNDDRHRLLLFFAWHY